MIMRPSRMNCGDISVFERNVICSTELSLSFIRQMSACGRNRLRDSDGPLASLVATAFKQLDERIEGDGGEEAEMLTYRSHDFR